MSDRGGDRRALGAPVQFGSFILLCLGVWLHAADTLVTATLVPPIVEDIGGVAYVGWTIALYQIGAVIAGAATAMLCNRRGVKTVLLSAALIYGFGCAVAALAPNMTLLLGARLMQGVGGGMLVALSTVAIQQSFPQDLWSRLFGVVAAIWGAGSLLAPLIGGLFASLGAWRLAFWFFAGQSGLLFVMASAWLPSRPIDEAVSGRWSLLVLFVLSLATVFIAEAGVAVFVKAAIVESVIGVVLLYVALRLDKAAAARLLPLRSLSFSHPIGAGLLMVLALSIGTTGFWAYGPLILKVLFAVNPLTSGFILAGESIAWTAATLAVARLPDRAEHGLIRAGASLVAGGAAGFAYAVPAGSLIGIVLCALLQGFGFGLCWPSIIRRMVQFCASGEGALAAGAPGTVQRIGYAVGSAATGIAGNASGLSEGISVDAARAAAVWIFAAFIPVLVVGLFGAWRFTSRSAERAALGGREAG